MKTRPPSPRRSHASAGAISVLLEAIVATPDAYQGDPSIINALQSQSALAKYSNPGRGISSSSLNTQKNAADATLEGGYAGLNALRLSALAVLSRKKSYKGGPSKGSRENLSNELRSAKVEIQQLLEDLFLLQRAFDIRCAQARRYAEASKSASIIALSKKEQREVEAGLLLRHKSTAADNVTPFPSKS